MERQVVDANKTMGKILTLLVTIMFSLLIFALCSGMFKDMERVMSNGSYFADDKTEDLVVELFTKQDTNFVSKTIETKRIMFSTPRYLREKERDRVVNYVLNYVANVGGKINDIKTEKLSDGGLIIFRSVDKIVKDVDIEVPKDSPFAENLKDILSKFMDNEKYTIERYNKRHSK